MTKQFTIFADALTEPRHAAYKFACCAFVVFEGETDGAKDAPRPAPVYEQFACVAQGETSSNNTYEYRAICAALRWIEANAPNADVTLRSDSQLAVRQISGEYECNFDHLRALRDECRAVLEKLRRTRLVWVRREFNTPADELTNQVYADARKQATYAAR